METVHHARAYVRNASGSWVELTDLEGVDFFDGAEVSEDQDQPVATARITLRRNEYDRTLVPGMAGPLNVDDDGAEADLLDVAREVRLDVQSQPLGYAAEPDGTWTTVFHGLVDDIDWASDGDTLTLACRDLGAQLQDVFIEVETGYCLGGATAVEEVIQAIIDDNVAPGVAAWSSGATYNVGDLVRPTTRNDWYYRCTTGGVAAGSEPTWPERPTATVADGAAVWRCVGRLPTLVVPSSPGWMLNRFVQQREPVMEAIRRLAQQLGWDLRYALETSSGAFRLQLRAPGRDQILAGGTVLTPADQIVYVTADDYRAVKVRRSIATVRNRISVVWSSYADPPVREATTQQDNDSVAAYGLRYGELAEASTSNVDTSTEAEDLRNNALADMKSPRHTYEVEAFFTPSARLFRTMLLTGDGFSMPAEQVACGIQGFSHTIGGDWRTTIRARAEAIEGAALDYHRRLVRPGIAPATPERADSIAASFRAYRNAAQNAANNAWTKVMFDVENYDLGGMFDASASIVPPRTGQYQLETVVTFTSVTSGQSVQAALFVNGTQYGPAATATAAATGALAVSVAHSLWLRASDTVDVRVFQNTGGALALSTGSALTNVTGKRVR